MELGKHRGRLEWLVTESEKVIAFARATSVPTQATPDVPQGYRILITQYNSHIYLHQRYETTEKLRKKIRATFIFSRTTQLQHRYVNKAEVCMLTVELRTQIKATQLVQLGKYKVMIRNYYRIRNNRWLKVGGGKFMEIYLGRGISRA